METLQIYQVHVCKLNIKVSSSKQQINALLALILPFPLIPVGLLNKVWCGG